jgi:hypothetical protein
MSFGKLPAQELRARTVAEGLSDYRSEADMRRDEVVSLLNRRFPYGLDGKTHGLMLPNELDMAKAAIQRSVTAFCHERHGANINATSRLINPACEMFSYFLYSEETGWYRVTPDSAIFFDEAEAA